MKTATVRQVQHRLAEVLDWVAKGEEVRVTRHGRTVARLLPPAAVRPPQAPDFLARAKGIWGSKPRGPKLSEIVDEDRGGR